MNRPHLFKHETFSEDDLWDVWASDPVFLPASPDGDADWLADWLMVAEVAGDVLFAALAPARSGSLSKARPIGLDRVKNEDLLRRYYESR